MKKLRSVAHVGHSQTPEDFMRIAKAFDWLAENGYDLPGKSDFIDLNKGRDFMSESKSYDAVVLHFLYRGDGHLGLKDHKKGQLAASPLSGWGAWRRKLAATNAKIIFAFGGTHEVSGSYLVSLEGYKTITRGEGETEKHDRLRMAVFIKEGDK